MYYRFFALLNCQSPLMTKVFVLIFFVLTTLWSFSQNDTLNKYSSKSRKTGYWIQFLDQNLSPVDSSESYFYGYEFYDDGHPVFQYTKNWWLKDSRLINIAPSSKKGKPVLLEGSFKWFGAADSLPFSMEVYKGGYPVTLYAFHQCSDHPWDISEFLDFTKKYNNEPGSFYFESGIGGMKKYWMRKENGKWKKHKIKEQPVK